MESLVSKVTSQLNWLGFASAEPDASQSSRKPIRLSGSYSHSTTSLPPARSIELRNEHGAEHPGAIPTFNVVVFGESGVGKSSVINLIAQKDIAMVSTDVDGCTMQSTRYDISFDGMNFAVFDTVGLEESKFGINGYLKAVEKAYEFIMKLSASGGIHLLLFCLRGGRITATALGNYRLFYECLCNTGVPIALVFTGLEMEREMEDWWARNRAHIEHYGIHSVGHACVTAVWGDETPEQAYKFMESQRAIRELLKRHILKDGAFSPEPLPWFASSARKMLRFITKRRSPKDEDIVRVLGRRCKLDPDTARRLADMIRGKNKESEDNDDTPAMAPIDGPDSAGEIANYAEIREERMKWECGEGVDKVTGEMMSCSSVEEILQAVCKRLGRRPEFVTYQAICDGLQQKGRVKDAISCFRQMQSELAVDTSIRNERTKWEHDFQRRCIGKLQKLADRTVNACTYDTAVDHLSTLLSLDGVDRINILIKFTRTMMRHKSVKEVLKAVRKFGELDFVVYQTICDDLEQDGHITEAISIFRQMQSELAANVGIQNERVEWEHDFQRRYLGKLVDHAMDARMYDAAIDHLTTLLSINGVDRKDVLIKRSEAHAFMESWGDALIDADDVIKLDPSSYRGYERRHVALRETGRDVECAEAFVAMLAKLHQSPHEDISDLRSRYCDARSTIRLIVSKTISNMPTILIDTTTGRLYDKSRLTAEFEAQPIWNELMSSMTRELDRASINNAVKGFYRYVMLSHTWEPDEPRLQDVQGISVHDLDPSATHIKLQRFCELVRKLGFRWAWADTICVDQKDNVVLQESLVAMFTWYRGSSLTLIYLRGVSSQFKSGHRISLRGSKWNTRGWTYQEYVAAEVVRFYTEDWEPYLDLTLENHKESSVIISEMRQATRISAEEMAVLQPGLDRVREKLFVASTRQTTRTEDIAYSLLGIFNAVIPVIYGEGDRAVGRLLEHILTGSGDVSILAWTGQGGSYNSCLPVDLTVYNVLAPPHIPEPIGMAKMNTIDWMPTMLSSFLWLHLSAVKLYNALRALPSPSIASSRLRLAGIICPITQFQCISPPEPSTHLHVYHLKTSFFGDVEFETKDQLTRGEDLCFIHPWIRPLLRQESQHRDRVGKLDQAAQASRFLARLRQPFGALLLQQAVGHETYRRVAADSLIMAQIRVNVPLTELMEGARTIDII